MAIYPASAATTTSQAFVSGVTYQQGVVVWERLERRTVLPRSIVRYSTALRPGRSKILRHGRPGLLEVVVRSTQRDGGPVSSRIVSRTLVRIPTPRIVAQGIGNSPLVELEARGLIHMAAVMRGVMTMLATAYTAGSSGGSGWTAIGRRAGYGIVAVDPRIIPLGTRLYIPGYGMAIAGDTGGDIVGRRIDLGFDSLQGALDFGRRDVTVYQLK
jgi:3D (Asp-Asp-Asp) domain-containing protein